MKATIDSTNERRAKQMAYNEAHGITPKAINKKLNTNALVQIETTEKATPTIAAEAEYSSYDVPKLEKEIASEQNLMKKAAKELNFIDAAQHRDRMRLLEAQLKAIKSNE